MGAHYGHVAAMVAYAILLFETLIVFFINDDGGQIRHGGKNGAAGANDNLRAISLLVLRSQ